MVSKLRAELLLLLSLAGLAPPASAEFFCCQDAASGRRACGDTLPDACRGRAYKVLDQSGNLLKEVGPPLTPEQKAALAEEVKRQKEQEELARERRRKDQALLDTYSSLKDIDMAQEKAENDVKQSIATAEAQIELIQNRRKKFEAEAEFYKKKTLPPEVDKGLQATGHEIKVQEELRNLKKNDFSAIKAKYDSDRRRYIELTGAGRRPSSAADSRPR